jgi:hypothetical protein
MDEKVDIVREFPDTTWADDGPTRGVEPVLEDGGVLSFPRLPFVLSPTERRFLNERWADGKAKNISVRWPSGELRGAAGTARDLADLRAMVVRYAEQSEAFALRLFPHYRGHLRAATPRSGPPSRPAARRAGARTTRACTVDAFPVEPDARHAALARVLQRQPGRPAARVAGRRAVRRACAALPRVDHAAAARARPG